MFVGAPAFPAVVQPACRLLAHAGSFDHLPAGLELAAARDHLPDRASRQRSGEVRLHLRVPRTVPVTTCVTADAVQDRATSAATSQRWAKSRSPTTRMRPLTAATRPLRRPVLRASSRRGAIRARTCAGSSGRSRWLYGLSARTAVGRSSGTLRCLHPYPLPGGVFRFPAAQVPQGH